MKEIKMYQCEICKKLYTSGKEAFECETRGKETPLANIGQKVMYNFGCDWSELIVTKIIDHGHELEYKFGFGIEDEEEWNRCYEYAYGSEQFQDWCKIID